MENIQKQNWVKIWTTKYSAISIELFAKEYIFEMKKEVGAGFEHILFRYENGLVTLFRIESETKEVAMTLAKNSIILTGYAEKSVAELSRIQNEIDKIIGIDAKIPSAEEFEKFVSLHLKLIPHFLVPIWASNEIKSIEGNEQRKIEVLALFEKARKDTEHMYSSIEKYICAVFSLISQKENINEAYLQALSLNEFKNYIQNGTLPDYNNLKERYEYSVSYTDSKGAKLFVGKVARELISRITEVKDGTVEIKGTKAFAGLVQGRVRIIFRDEDCNKFQPGEILMTTMTRPEWLPIMQQAAAFVTDAGGILCHAAIVAREMKIPCVTNTKIATQVFKDGDLVEVDANTGVVKIIK